LCCPTCIEFGRTSFFCGQECFTKNWKTHGQLHDLLRKKRALATNGADTNGAADTSSVAQRPKQPGVAEDNSRGLQPVGSSRRGLAPLPGGSALVRSNSAKEKRAHDSTSASKGKDHPPASPGLIGSLAGTALSLISAPFKSNAGTSNTQGAVNRRPGGHGAVPPSPRGTRGAPGGTTLGGRGPFWATFSRRFALNGLLWVLAITTLLASCMFYREHLRYADANQIDRDSATLEVASSSESVTAEAAATAGESVTAAVESGLSSLAGLGGLTGSSSPSASTAASGKDAGIVTALRAEVTALRELVERHDKMLRYVMDRYVEKSGAAPIDSGAKSSAAHEASVVNFSEPEFLSKSDYDGAAAPPVKAGDGHRKRSRVEGALADGVGEPVAEEVRAESKVSTTLKEKVVGSDVGAVQKEKRNNFLGNLGI